MQCLAGARMTIVMRIMTEVRAEDSRPKASTSFSDFRGFRCGVAVVVIRRSLSAKETPCQLKVVTSRT